MNTMSNMNPIVEMLSRRFKIPTNIGNNPNDILQHLINSGQVSQAQVDQITQLRNMFMQK